MYFLFAIFDIFSSFESAPHRWGRGMGSETGYTPINTGYTPINTGYTPIN